MSAKLVIVSALITLSIIGVLGLYFVILTDLQNLDAQQRRLLPDESIFDDASPSLDIFEGTQQLKKFSSDDEMKDFLQKIRSENSYVNYRDFRGIAIMDSDFAGVFPVPSSSEFQSQSGGLSAASEWSSSAGSGTPTHFDERDTFGNGNDPAFSSTNIQVIGVDEPDHIKTDGKYIYVLQDHTLSIIDAYPAEDASLISRTTLDIQNQKSHNMFLNNGKLVIFYAASNYEKRITDIDNPTRIGAPVTHIVILDVDNPKSPEILKDYEVDGEFYDARMIGNYVYLISTMNADHNDIVTPYITEHNSSGLIFDPDVFYFDNFEPEYIFNTITSINVSDVNFINAKTFLMGSADTIYSSQNGLYITYKKSLSSAHHEAIKKDRFFNVIVPKLPISIQNKINEIQNDSTINSSKKYSLVTDLLENTYDNIGYVDKRALFSNIEEQLAVYDSRVQQELENTVIHKIGIDKGSIEHKAQGGIPGWLLNQFSVDEYKDSLRVVTTYENYEGDGRTIRYNAVHVMDIEQLDVTGTLKGIAPNENVFSARFMGDRLYLVTFERIDPFFVVDLSSDDPKILGDLKIPGFSNYLHPYDEDHIIGIGRNADSFGVQQPGVKIALFDVSDVKNPSVVDDIIIGNSRETGSEALDDHKAFFFDKNRDILSIPIHDNTASSSESFDTQDVWNGFYVYGLDSNGGFDLKGKIKHSESSSIRSQIGYRSFYIDDALYTASPSTIKINDLDDINNEINSIRLDNSYD